MIAVFQCYNFLKFDNSLILQKSKFEALAVRGREYNTKFCNLKIHFLSFSFLVWLKVFFFFNYLVPIVELGSVSTKQK
jgi:hypothetical protein